MGAHASKHAIFDEDGKMSGNFTLIGALTCQLMS
jgi:hypothetical protein